MRGSCLRITFLTPPDSLTGGIRVVAQYARELQARGHDVTIVSNARAKPGLVALLRGVLRGNLSEVWQSGRAQRGHLAESGVKCIVLEKARKITAQDMPDGDVVVATWWETAVWMNELLPSKGRPIHLIQGYEIWGNQSQIDQVHLALRLPNLKIAISSGLKKEIETQLGSLDIQVIPNAIDGQQFDAPRRNRNVPPRVGYLYAKTPMKGADRCHAIIEAARRTMPALQVLAFGVDVPSPDVPVPNGTKYIRRPDQEEIAGLYAQCDAWLFATRVDSFGLPILEAMACRTPVVGLPVGAAPDLLADGNGVLVSPDQEADIPKAMATALVDLLQGPETTWLAMSNRAYKRAHSYSWKDAAQHFENLVSAGQ